MPAAPRSCLHTYGGQDGGRDLYRGTTTRHPTGLERDYEQEFIVGHGHAQLGQLCADLRRTCHGAAAAHRRISHAMRASRSHRVYRNTCALASRTGSRAGRCSPFAKWGKCPPVMRGRVTEDEWTRRARDEGTGGGRRRRRWSLRANATQTRTRRRGGRRRRWAARFRRSAGSRCGG